MMTRRSSTNACDRVVDRNGRSARKRQAGRFAVGATAALLAQWTATAAADEAAQTIDVVVLSRHAPQQIRIAEGACRHGRLLIEALERRGARVAACDRRGRCKLSRRVKLECAAPGKLTFDRQGSAVTRAYGRAFTVSIRDKALRVLAHLPMDVYLAGVVDAEMAGGPEAARRAQIVVARTYALRALARPRHDDAHVCDLTHCQVFAGQGRPATMALVRRTQGWLSDDRERPAEVFYHSTCGGRTLPAHSVWPGASTPDLVGVDDLRPDGRAWCANSRHFRWFHDVTDERLARALRPAAGAELHAPSLWLRSDDEGRTWTVGDRDGQFRVAGAQVHRTLGRALGWGTVKSSRFEALRTGRKFHLRGSGLGHRVGLCQTGAIARAKAGQSTEAILRAYFPRLRWTQ